MIALESGTYPRTRATSIRFLLLCICALPVTAQQYDLEEVIGLSIEDGRLIAEMRFTQVGFGGRGRRSFEISNIRGSASVSGSSGRGILISTSHSHGPGGIEGNLQLNCQSFGLRIKHEFMGNHNVVYEQLESRDNSADPAERGAMVLLRVTFDRSTEKLEYRAPDFATLCAEHPREASLYLGPVFRVLKLGRLFSVEDRFARQVLAEPPPRDELSARVRNLVKQLDSDDPRGRRAAAGTLLELGLPANELLESISRATLTPQQQAEVEAILHHSYAPNALQAKAIVNDAQFMLDCLYNSDPRIQDAALDRLRQLSDKPVQIDLTDDPMKRSEAIEKLRDTLSLKKK